MDDLCNETGRQGAALVILAFLQADCKSSEYGKELFSLGEELNLTRDIISDGPWIDAPDDGDLETDGHLPSSMSIPINGIEPSVELQRPRNREDAAALQQVAEDLREIAAQFEHNVVAEATRNLRRSISASPSEPWQNHLANEVKWVMTWAVGLEHLQVEQVTIALTLALVRGVCEEAPQFLRKLFSAALQYIRPA